MKKILCLLLVAVLVLPIVLIPVQADDPVESEFYADVFEDDPYCEAVTYLYHQGIMTGTDDATATSKALFSPNASLTRGQMVTVLWRMAGCPDPVGTPVYYTDCVPGASYYNAVLWASSSGVQITMGTSPTLFQPSSSVSHQQAITFLYRFLCLYHYIEDDVFYFTLFVNSDLVNKSSFSSYAKIPAGWAVSEGILTDMNVVPTSACPRHSIAEYIYRVYRQYQEKFGLVVVRSNNLDVSLVGGQAMKTVLTHYGASIVELKDNITKTQFATAMSTVFSDAKPLDICYVFCASHGGVTGLTLFEGSGMNEYLTPSELRSQIDSFNGTFVVFISGCNSGTFIDRDNGHDDSIDIHTQYDFSASTFVASLMTSPRSGEMADSNRIKVLCSSKKNQFSHNNGYFSYAPFYWCAGCGFDLTQDYPQTFGIIYADTNVDNKVTLEELYSYSYVCVLSDCPNQEVVRYPVEDVFIIIE